MAVADGHAAADASSRFLRPAQDRIDRKSTRLNSSHMSISYAVFCLKKKKKKKKSQKDKNKKKVNEVSISPKLDRAKRLINPASSTDTEPRPASKRHIVESTVCGPS